jgi:hypothetical protein
MIASRKPGCPLRLCRLVIGLVPGLVMKRATWRRPWRLQRALSSLLLAGATVAVPAQGFDCAPLQASASRAPGYGRVPGQARCEGFFERGVSQPFIELVSLTRGQSPAVTAGAASAPLEIYAEAQGSVRLVVQPQRSSPFYRVDAPMPGAQALAWDPAPMLAATRLPLSDLGFIAVLSASTPATGALPAVVPVAFTAAARVALRVYAVVRVSVEVSSVAWRAYRPGVAALPTWADVPGSHLYAWRRITLPIDLPADGKGLWVDVQAVSASDSQALPLLRFAIVGPGDAPPR